MKGCCHVAGWPGMIFGLSVCAAGRAGYGAVVQNHRYSVEVISHGVWLYFRFPLSFREVEEPMLERGAVVSYETDGAGV